MGFEIGRASTADVQVMQQNSLGTGSSEQIDPNLKTTIRMDQQHHGERSTTEEEMRRAVKTLNQLISPHQTNLHFAFHDKLDKYYVQIVDTDTKQVIREIPPKKFLDAHAATLELLGFLVDKKI